MGSDVAASRRLGDVAVRESSLGVRWVQFVRHAMGLPSARASLMAMALGVAIWLFALGVSPVSKAWIVILELFTALAIANELPSLINRRHWPVQPVFLWSRTESQRLYPAEADGDDGLISEVDALVSGGSGEPGTWGEVRALAADLRPAARREHILAMAGLFETGEFDSAAFEAGLTDLPDEAERRYWRVRLAMTRAFASHDEGGDYLPLLLAAAAEEGPFTLAPASRWRLFITRYLVGAFFLAVGLAVAAPMAIAGNA